MNHLHAEIASAAARLVVQEGLEYGAAKTRALKVLGLPSRTSLPDNDQIHDAVVSYLELFCADTQPGQWLALLEHAVIWMKRLSDYQPLLGGSVWNGTATDLSDIYLHVFSDDEKQLEIDFINHHVDYVPNVFKGFRGEEIPGISVHTYCDVLRQDVGLHLLLHPTVDLRGALKPDRLQRTLRGDLKAAQAKLKALKLKWGADPEKDQAK